MTEQGTQELEAPAEHQPRYRQTRLILACASLLLEEGGEAEIAVIQERFEELGVDTERSGAVINKSMVKRGKATLEAGKLSITALGMEYVARHTDSIDESYERASEKKPKFTATKYEFLSFLEQESYSDGWLFDADNLFSATKHLAHMFNNSEDAINRKLKRYETAKLIEKEKQGRLTTNVRLTDEGTTELEVLREQFPEKIAELELGLTIQSMREEINHMCEQLGDIPEDFTDASSFSKVEAKLEVVRLAETMSELERRLDNRPVLQVQWSDGIHEQAVTAL